jgi:hypothetical protein
MRMPGSRVGIPLFAIAASIGYLNIWDSLDLRSPDLGMGDLWDDYQFGQIVVGWPHRFVFFDWEWKGAVVDLLLAIFLLGGSAAALSAWSCSVQFPANLNIGGVLGAISVVAIVLGERHVCDYWDDLDDRTDDVCFGIVCAAFGLSTLASFRFVGHQIRKCAKAVGRADSNWIVPLRHRSTPIVAATIANGRANESSAPNHRSATLGLSILAASILYVNVWPTVDYVRVLGIDSFRNGFFASSAIVG